MTFKERLSKIEDYIHKYWYYVASPLVIGFIMIYMLKAQDDTKELEGNLKTTVGKVCRYSGVPRKSKIIYYYEFYLNSKKYQGSSTGYMFDGVSVGDYYQVEYSGLNADNNRMNFNIGFLIKIKKDSIGRIVDTNYVRI